MTLKSSISNTCPVYLCCSIYCSYTTYTWTYTRTLFLVVDGFLSSHGISIDASKEGPLVDDQEKLLLISVLLPITECLRTASFHVAS